MNTAIEVSDKSNGAASKPLQSRKVDFETHGDRKAGELLNSENLKLLNLRHAYFLRENFPQTQPGGGFVRKIVGKFRSKVFDLFFRPFMAEYFASELNYHSHLVRLLNDTVTYIDARDASAFWELIRKIDYDVGKVLERVERISSDQSADLINTKKELIELINSSLGKLLSTSDQHDTQIRTLDSVCRGLEGIVAQLKREPSPVAGQKSKEDSGIDYSYVLLENRYRGSEEEISRRVAIYPPLFSGAKLPILEIGSGRGELQELFKQSGIDSYGVDLDEAMASICSRKGLKVFLGNGLEHLASLPDRSLGGVIAVQVIEHLTRDQLQELFRLCKSKVCEGGKIVFETINSDSIVALSINYFRDPTHVWPMHPETVRFGMELLGLKVSEVRKLSPFSAESQLRELTQESYMTPRMNMLLEEINHNFRRLNDILFGYQDYCIIAEA